jgi:hypothetical protein
MLAHNRSSPQPPQMRPGMTSPGHPTSTEASAASLSHHLTWYAVPPSTEADDRKLEVRDPARPDPRVPRVPGLTPPRPPIRPGSEPGAPGGSVPGEEVTAGGCASAPAPVARHTLGLVITTAENVCVAYRAIAIQYLLESDAGTFSVQGPGITQYDMYIACIAYAVLWMPHH